MVVVSLAVSILLRHCFVPFYFLFYCSLVTIYYPLWIGIKVQNPNSIYQLDELYIAVDVLSLSDTFSSSFTQSLTHSLNHSLNHSLSLSLTHSLSLTYFLTLLVTPSFSLSLPHSFSLSLPVLISHAISLSRWWLHVLGLWVCILQDLTPS